MSNTECVDYNNNGGYIAMLPCHTGKNQQWDFLSVDVFGSMKAMALSPGDTKTAQSFYNTGSHSNGCLKYEPQEDSPQEVKMGNCMITDDQALYFDKKTLVFQTKANNKMCVTYVHSTSKLLMKPCQTNSVYQQWEWLGVTPRLTTKAKDGQCIQAMKKGEVKMMKCDARAVKQKWSYSHLPYAKDVLKMKAAPTSAKTARSLYSLSDDHLCVEYDKINATLKMVTCMPNVSQKFYREKSADQIKVADVTLGVKCLNYDAKSKKLAPQGCAGTSSSQKWYFDIEGHLRVQSENGVCLDYNADSMKLHMTQCSHILVKQTWNFKTTCEMGTIERRVKLPKDTTTALNFYTVYESDYCMVYETGASNVRMWPCNGNANQRFYFVRDSLKVKGAGPIKGVNADSVTAASTKKGKDHSYCVDYDKQTLNVFVTTCEGVGSQKFEYDCDRHIRSKGTDLCIKHSISNGNLFMAKCDEKDTQRWYYVDKVLERRLKLALLNAPTMKFDARKLRNSNTTSLCMDHSSTKVFMNRCSKTSNTQKFFLSGGRLESLGGMCLDFNMNDDLTINLYAINCTAAKSQKFIYDGMTLKSNGMCMSYTTTTSGERVRMMKCTKANRQQQWHFEARKLHKKIAKTKMACFPALTEAGRKYSSSAATQSKLDAPGAWLAGKNAKGEWMQIDLGKVLKVGGVVTQGRAMTREMVTQYKVQLSKDALTWETVPGTFKGNSDVASKEFGIFSMHNARHVRIVVEAWAVSVSMRAAVLVCGHPPTPAPTLAPGATYAPTFANMYANGEQNKGGIPSNALVTDPGCYVFASECPKQTFQFTGWTRDLFGEKTKGAGEDSQACTKTRQGDYNTWCDCFDCVKMMFIPLGGGEPIFSLSLTRTPTYSPTPYPSPVPTHEPEHTHWTGSYPPSAYSGGFPGERGGKGYGKGNDYGPDGHPPGQAPQGVSPGTPGYNGGFVNGLRPIKGQIYYDANRNPVNVYYDASGRPVDAHGNPITVYDANGNQVTIPHGTPVNGNANGPDGHHPGESPQGGYPGSTDGHPHSDDNGPHGGDHHYDDGSHGGGGSHPEGYPDSGDHHDDSTHSQGDHGYPHNEHEAGHPQGDHHPYSDHDHGEYGHPDHLQGDQNHPYSDHGDAYHDDHGHPEAGHPPDDYNHPYSGHGPYDDHGNSHDYAHPDGDHGHYHDHYPGENPSDPHAQGSTVHDKLDTIVDGLQSIGEAVKESEQKIVEGIGEALRNLPHAKGHDHGDYYDYYCDDANSTTVSTTSSPHLHYDQPHSLASIPAGDQPHSLASSPAERHLK
jgi:hypothetical protein